MGDSYTTQSDEPCYNCESDANTLKQHAEITSDPKRHKAAHEHLLKQQALHDTAVQGSHKMLQKKVKHGLKKAFPKAGDTSGPTPFEKAGGSNPDDSSYSESN